MSNDVYNNTGVNTGVRANNTGVRAATRCLVSGGVDTTINSLSLNMLHLSNETYTDVTVQQCREETQRTAYQRYK